VDPYAASTYMWTTNPPSYYQPDDWSPGAAAWGCNGRLDVFARGTDNKLYQKWTDNTHGWSPQWTNLGGNITSGPSGASALCAREDIFARGAAGAIDHKWYYNGWQPWDTLPGTVNSGPGAVSWRCNGRLDVFVRGTDNALWQKWTDDTHGWLPNWFSLQGNIASAPAAASFACARYDVFARGPDGLIWHKWFQGSWQPWESFPGAVSSAPGATSYRCNNRLDIYARGPDNTL
jgi:hypothetical protein